MQLTREIDQFLSIKRARKLEKKRRRKWRVEQQRRERYAIVNAAFGGRSEIIKMVSDAYAGEAEKHQGALQLDIPETFSVLEAPEKAIGVVTSFAKAVRSRPVRSVFLNHRGLKHYDLAANGLLDVVAMEVNRERSGKKRGVRWRGKYPADRDLQRFIRALGIIKHLGLEHEYPKPDEAAELRVFDVRNRHYYRAAQPEKADYKTNVVARFADHINYCLRDNGRELTQLARHNLCEYTGEILDNAEQHADMLDWSIQGYLDNSLDTPLCEIAIFNFGRTIAQTLKVLPRDSYTAQQIAPYMDAHKRSRWFSPSWSEEDLLTLVALQGHVSCKNRSASDTRGNGTVDLIEFFQQVHLECAQNSPIPAKMAIVSGGTYILFDGTYKLTMASSGAKTIAFNKSNDLNDKPDATYVKGLRGFRIPGTVISIRFPLSVTSTKTVKTDHDTARN